MKKTRLDIFLARSGLSPSREKSKREIMAGWVKVDGETVTDPARQVAGTERVTVERPGGLYVSRGGQKLKYALDRFGISLRGKTAVDLGASTGGFTDCMLKEGAAKVFAVDVGYGQLDYSLRKDPRVTVMEKTNARSLTREQFSGRVDFVTADLSFISIIKVFDTIRDIFAPVEGVILVKPQFEAEPGEHKKGVVRRKEIHVEILSRVVAALEEKGMIMKGIAPSPVTGPKGNIEFVVYFECGTGNAGMTEPARDTAIAEAVSRAHEQFGTMAGNDVPADDER
ncbi:MAG TPA: TlyA family RNA methyltransferase [Spirochaetota bacterium]|nr:TlyA family RNA methyltransferase [Spirochaetota bacterium]HPC42983.1 TlyA family RNA methyltransferase [Spirochaetota bacterium]HPL18574.1 TlyA family RNA methyltransferase [Spirochaetota bacterium]HQF10082.1 TlyA family RNA methyltransferase [Spirochaetota bacterium]HQH98822.1 TlyA family RNA methyltransferase [Spirochaetota bacterium]